MWLPPAEAQQRGREKGDSHIWTQFSHWTDLLPRATHQSFLATDSPAVTKHLSYSGALRIYDEWLSVWHASPNYNCHNASFRTKMISWAGMGKTIKAVQHPGWDNRQSLEAHLLGFISWLCYLLAWWPWASHITFLGLNFLICKVANPVLTWEGS